MSVRRPASRAGWLVLLVCLGLAGCAHTYYRYPGPLASVGKAAPLVEEWDEGSVWDGVDPLAETSAQEANDGGAPATGTAEDQAPPGANATKRGEAVAKAARSYLGARSLRHGGDSFRYDCSGLVMAAHAKAGLSFAGSSESMFTMAKDSRVFHEREEPWVGDVAFFENTYDKNRNGRLDDPITHVAVVVDVDDDGTITVVHKGSKGISLLVMNLHRPGERATASGKELNGYLRARRSGDRRGTSYLSGELWIGFGSFWKVLESH